MRDPRQQIVNPTQAALEILAGQELERQSVELCGIFVQAGMGEPTATQADVHDTTDAIATPQTPDPTHRRCYCATVAVRGGAIAVAGRWRLTSVPGSG